MEFGEIFAGQKMERVLGILSIFAGVLIAGTFLSTGLSQPDSADAIGRQLAQNGFQFHIDPMSFVAGVIGGVALCQLAKICWVEIPRRVATWLNQNIGHFGYICACGALLVVLIYI